MPQRELLPATEMTQDYPGTPDDNIGARTRTAAGWQFLSRGINTALQMVTSIVLARLLMPDDFGIIAMAMMVTGLGLVFQDLGLGQALVQRERISEKHTRAAFWGTLVMAGLLYGSVVLSAPHIGVFFDEPRMVPVIKTIAFVFLFAPFAVVPRSMLQRDLDFKTQFFATLIGSLGYGIVGIGMALLDYGYWALVGAALASAGGNAVTLCILMRYLPPFVPSFRGLGDLYGFGTGATGVGLLNYIAQQIDYLVIGRWLDSAALGLYEKAFRLVHAPLAIIGGIISPVLFPVFSRLQEQQARAREIMGKILTVVAALSFPPLAVFAVAAPELIPLVLGEQWVDAVAPAQILAAAGALRTLVNPAAMLPKGFGAIYAQMWRNGVYAAVLFVGAIVGSNWGIIGVAWAALFATVVVWSLNTQLLYAVSRFGLRDYFRAIREPLLISAVTIPVTAVVRHATLAQSLNPWLVLSATIFSGIVVFVIFILGPCARCRTLGREIIPIRLRGGSLKRFFVGEDE